MASYYQLTHAVLLLILVLFLCGDNVFFYLRRLLVLLLVFLLGENDFFYFLHLLIFYFKMRRLDRLSDVADVAGIRM